MEESNQLNSRVKKHYSPLKNFIRKRVATAEDAEDILQDIFYQLSKADSLLHPIENVGAWLYRIARNHIINLGKKKKTERLPVIRNNNAEDEEYTPEEVMDVLMEEYDTPETELYNQVISEEIEAALSELPQEQREAFELTEMLGLSFKEISDTTGVPVNTLISRKRYAVLYLRKQLKDLYEDVSS